MSSRWKTGEGSYTRHWGPFPGDKPDPEASGAGTLYTFTRPTAPPRADALPQLLAILELDEEPRLSSEMVDVAPAALRVGMRVKAVFHDQPGQDITLPRFAPA